MFIEIGEYRIRKSDGINKFDLYKPYEVKKGGNEGKIINKDKAYGVSLERCFQIISHDSTFSLSGSLDLETYLERYNEITNKLIKEVSKMK